MTIRIEVTNPAEHQPSELRAVATFLSNLAADREAGRIEHVAHSALAVGISAADNGELRDLSEVKQEWQNRPLVSVHQATSAAPGASSPEETEPDADVSDACDTSQLDSEGVTWDERIHSETKSQNKDGTWRLRRGVDKALVEQVIAEQRAAAEDTPPPPPAEEDDAPELPTEETPPPVTETAADVKPADVIKFISTNKLEAATVNAMCEELGMKRAADLFTNQSKANALLELLKPLVE